jgi:hypothetical protein
VSGNVRYRTNVGTTGVLQRAEKMPRACPVELHAHNHSDATGLPRGASRSQPFRCHGLVPWSFTLTATLIPTQPFRCHGLVPWSFTLTATLIPTQPFRCHGLVPWSFTLTATLIPTQPFRCHGLVRGASRSQLYSCEREAPRDKPVAS